MMDWYKNIGLNEFIVGSVAQGRGIEPRLREPDGNPRKPAGEFNDPTLIPMQQVGSNVFDDGFGHRIWSLVNWVG